MNLNINVNSGIQRAGTPTTGNQGNKQGHFLQLGQLTKVGRNNIDIKEQSARRTKSLTAQVMRNAEKMESVFLDRIDNSRSNIATNKQKMDKSFTAYKDSYNAKQKLAEEFEISSDEMKLLDKAYNVEKGNGDTLALTEEEQTALAELRNRPGVSDYEEQANVLNEEMDTYREEVNDSIKAIKKENYILSTVKQEYLKVHIMADANREIDNPLALGIGMFQLIAAIFPGTSRSGATIIGGLLLGMSRGLAAEFTFFLAIPVMFGASLLKLVKFGLHFTGLETAVLLTGMVVSFAVSYFVIKFLMGYIKKHDFKIFGWYRIVLGVAVLLYFALLAGK